jgi:hypothetical protein
MAKLTIPGTTDSIRKAKSIWLDPVQISVICVYQW